MTDDKKTKGQLIRELAEMRGRIAEFEASKAGLRQSEEDLIRHREQLQKLVDDRTSKLMLFSRAFEEAMDGIQIIDLNGYIIYSNKAVEEIYGYTADDLTGKHINELNVNIEFGEQVVLPSIYETGRWTGEFIVRHKDDHQFPIWLSLSMVKYENGDPAAIVGVIRDMSERKRWEQEIQLANTELDQIFNTAVDGMIVIDKDFKVLRVNKTLLSLLGWEYDEIIGKKCYEVFASADLCHTTDCPLKKILGGDAQVEFETGKTRKDGVNIPCLVTAAPFKKPDGEIIGIVEDIRDITERKKREENTLKTRNLESIGILAGGIAHDFNNLLSAIIGDIGIAKMFVPRGNKAIGRLDNAEQICTMASDLSKRLITFATGGEPVKSTVQLLELLMDTVSTMLNGSNISAEFDLPGDLYPVALDEGQMKQVVSHLAINAKEAMPHGGTLTVRGENVRISARDSSPMRAGNFVKISFRDTGVGIPSENMAKIFDPYFSTKETYNQKGLGLGLAVCYSVIKKHDGLITVESEVGKGTTYHMYLPAAGSR